MGQVRRVFAVLAAVAVVGGYVALVEALNSPPAARAVGNRASGAAVVSASSPTTALVVVPVPTTTTTAVPGPPVEPGALASPVFGVYDVTVVTNSQPATGTLSVAADGTQLLAVGNVVRPMQLKWTASQSELISGAESCEWSPRVIFVAAKLVEGRHWSSNTSCVATEDGKTVSIRRQESARVKGRTRTHIGDKAIDTWIIERRVISTKRIGAVTVVVDEAVNELFAPTLGLNVYRLSQTDTPRPNGGVETLVESIQLLSTTPH